MVPPGSTRVASERSGRAVLLDVLEHVDGDHRRHGGAHRLDGPVQVELVGLDLGSVREPARELPHGRRVDVGDDQPLEAGELAGELAEPGPHLEHGAAAVPGDEVELVGAVPPLVAPEASSRVRPVAWVKAPVAGVVAHAVPLLGMVVGCLGAGGSAVPGANSRSSRKKRSTNTRTYTSRKVRSHERPT